VRTAAVLPESPARNVRRVTSLCIEFPFLFFLNSYFLRLAAPAEIAPKNLLRLIAVKYVAAIDSQLSHVRQNTNTPWWVGPIRSDCLLKQLLITTELV